MPKLKDVLYALVVSALQSLGYPVERGASLYRAVRCRLSRQGQCAVLVWFRASLRC